MDQNKLKYGDNSGVLDIPEASIELHAHIPFLTKDNFMDVALAIEQKNLDVVALEGLDESIFKKVCEGVRSNYNGTIKDSAGIRYDGKRFILNAREYTTREGFHLLTVGHSVDDAKPNADIRKLIDEGLKNDALVVVAHPFVDTGRLKTAGHISSEKEKELADLCKEYAGQITLEWNGYCNPMLRDGLKQLLNLFGEDIKYYDVNHKVYDFAYSPEIFKLRIPLVPGTDLHAVNKNYLSALGTSRLYVDINGETPSEILESMKKGIFERSNSGKFSDEYASALHVIGAYGIPLLKEIFHEKNKK
jgi:hypothetical protein